MATSTPPPKRKFKVRAGSYVNAVSFSLSLSCSHTKPNVGEVYTHTYKKHSPHLLTHPSRVLHTLSKKKRKKEKRISSSFFFQVFIFSVESFFLF